MFLAFNRVEKQNKAKNKKKKQQQQQQQQQFPSFDHILNIVLKEKLLPRHSE